MHPDSNERMISGSCERAQPMEPPMPQNIVGERNSLSRQRYGELVQLGIRASKELTDHGLQRNEYCEFGRIMDKIMQLD